MTVQDEPRVLAALEEAATWPNLSQAAAIVGVNKSTLSKQATHGRIRYETRGLGQTQRVVSPQEVLRIARRYQRVSRDTAVERLSTFFAHRIPVDRDLLARVLWRLTESTSGTDAVTSSQDQYGRDGSEMRTDMNHASKGHEPGWLQAWAALRTTSVEATLSFTSPDDIIGTIHVGPLVDEVGVVTEVTWPAS